MFNIINHQEDENQNHHELPLRVCYARMRDQGKYWRGRGEVRTVAHGSGDVKWCSHFEKASVSS